MTNLEYNDFKEGQRFRVIKNDICNNVEYKIGDLGTFKVEKIPSDPNCNCIIDNKGPTYLLVNERDREFKLIDTEPHILEKFKVGNVVRRIRGNTVANLNKNDTGVVISIFNGSIEVRYFNGITCYNDFSNLELVK